MTESFELAMTIPDELRERVMALPADERRELADELYGSLPAAPARSTASEPTEPALEAAMRRGEDVADVYADWLMERGHPRGRFIAVQRALRERPDDAELRDEQHRLIAELAPDLAHLELEWRDGFVYGAMIASIGDLATLLRDPSARFLRELVARDRIGTLEVLARAPSPPPLRKLDFAFDNRGPFGDTSQLGARYPTLEELAIGGQDGELALHAPALRALAIYSAELPKKTLASIVRADWPHLDKLDLFWFRDDATPELAPLLGDRAFPALRRLALGALPACGALCRALVASPRARVLDELRLGELDDAAAEFLVAHRAAFPQLARFFGDGDHVSAEVDARLGEAFPPR